MHIKNASITCFQFGSAVDIAESGAKDKDESMKMNNICSKDTE